MEVFGEEAALGFLSSYLKHQIVGRLNTGL
jgi:hypothetical protein